MSLANVASSTASSVGNLASTTTTRLMSSLTRIVDYVDGIRFSSRGREYLNQLFNRSKPSVLDLVHRSEKGIASRVVSYWPTVTWGDGFYVIENDDKDLTPFEQAIRDIIDTHSVVDTFTSLDIEAGTGHYACLFLGINSGGALDFSKEIPKNINNQITWIKPLHQLQAEVTDIVTDPSSPDWGKPFMYKVYPYKLVNRFGKTITDSTKSFPVHHSWIIHYSPNAIGSTLYGQPDLAKVWDILDDLELISGSYAQIFFKTARSLFISSLKDGVAWDDELVAKFRAEVDQATKEFNSHMITDGFETDVLNPSNKSIQAEIGSYMTLLSVVLSVSRRILEGTEEGKLAGEQDRQNTGDVARRRRSRQGEKLVRAFVDRLIKYQVIEAPVDKENKYRVEFNEQEEMTLKEKIVALKDITQANKNQRDANGEQAMSPVEYRDLLFDMGEIENVKPNEDDPTLLVIKPNEKEVEVSAGEEN